MNENTKDSNENSEKARHALGMLSCSPVFLPCSDKLHRLGEGFLRVRCLTNGVSPGNLVLV